MLPKPRPLGPCQQDAMTAVFDRRTPGAERRPTDACDGRTDFVGRRMKIVIAEDEESAERRVQLPECRRQPSERARVIEQVAGERDKIRAMTRAQSDRPFEEGAAGRAVH